MPRSLTPQDAGHLLQRCTTWALCWKLELGTDVLRQTAHDAPITAALDTDEYGLNGTYDSSRAFQASALRSSTDLAVDNMDVDGLLDNAGITEQDIVTGALDDARYTLFLINWRDPANSGIPLKRGVVGNVRAFTQDLLKGELRGLSQFLAQITMETYGPSCRAELGDARCQVDLAAYTISGEIDSIVVQRRIFTSGDRNAGSPTLAAGWFNGGVLTMTNGNNAGFSVEVKVDDGSGELELFEPMPYDWEVGDSWTMVAGCDKARITCRDKFNNMVNRRAEDYIPGVNRLAAGSR